MHYLANEVKLFGFSLFIEFIAYILQKILIQKMKRSLLKCQFCRVSNKQLISCHIISFIVLIYLFVFILLVTTYKRKILALLN